MKYLIDKLVAFRNERNWGVHHTAGELARSLMIEAAELNRLFQWYGTILNNERNSDIADELADIMIYSLYLCEKYGFNPEHIINEKIKKNAIKYPAVD